MTNTAYEALQVANDRAGELQKEVENLKIKMLEIEKQRDDLDLQYRTLVANVTALLIEKREYLEVTGVSMPLKSEARIEKALQKFRDREVLALPFS